MKKLALYSIIGFGLYFVLKGRKIAEILKSLKVKILTVRNIKLSLSKITFNIDVLVSNPSNQDLNIKGNDVIKISKIYIYTQSGFLIGEAIPEITNLSIPPNGQIRLNNIPTATETSNILKIILQTKNPLNLTTKTEIEAFGKTFLI